MKPIFILLVVLLMGPLYGVTLTVNTPVRQIVVAYKITKDFEIARLIVLYSYEYRVPVSLALAVAYNESMFNSECVSLNRGSKDIGVFQLNTKSYSRYTIRELFHVETNIRFGISHLSGNLKKNKYNVNKALAAYNAGQSRVNKNNIPASTKVYVDKVINTTIEYEGVL